MRHRNGEGLDHRGGDDEAQELERLGRRLEVLVSAEKFIGQDRVVRAELIGSDKCTAEGCTVQAAAPVLAICRKLVEAGVDSRRTLHAYRGDVLALSVRTIGEGAKLTTKERRFGPVFETWVAFPTPPAASPMRATPRPRCRSRSAL